MSVTILIKFFLANSMPDPPDSEVGGRTVCRLLVRDAAGDSESTLLHETAPQWVTDVVIERNIPKFLKIPFFLQPHPQMTKPERTKKVRTFKLQMK